MLTMVTWLAVMSFRFFYCKVTYIILYCMLYCILWKKVTMYNSPQLKDKELCSTSLKMEYLYTSFEILWHWRLFISLIYIVMNSCIVFYILGYKLILFYYYYWNHYYFCSSSSPFGYCELLQLVPISI